MVREIVHHRHAGFRSLHLKAPLDAFKTSERLESRPGIHPRVPRRRHRRQGIQLIVPAGKIHGEAPERFPAKTHVAFGRDSPTALAVKTLQAAPAPLFQHPIKRFTVTVGNDEPRRRHRTYQVMKLLFNRSEIFKNVGVIVFEVIQNRGTRPIVHKLAALIKKGRVVFVGFNHEVTPLPEARRHAEILRYAAHQKAGFQSCVIQNPGYHRRRRRFSVRSRHRQNVPALQNVFTHPLRARGVGEPGVENRFQQGIAAGYGVADHPQVRLYRELRSVIAFRQTDPRLFQLIAHRRINIFIAPRHRVSRLHRKLSHTAHERTADTQNMNVHDESAKKTKDARHCTARSRAAEAATIVFSSLFYERYVH